MNLVKISNQKYFNLGLIFLAWTLYGLFFASQNYLRQAYFGSEADWQRALAVWLTCGYSWAILTPAVLFVARRFRFGRATWLRALLVHIPLSVFFGLAVLALYTGLRFLLAHDAIDYQKLVVSEIHASVIIYFVIIGIIHAVDYVSRPAVVVTPLKNNVAVNGASISKNGELAVLSSAQATKTTKPEPAFAERFTIKENGRILFVRVNEIDRITSEGNYVKLHTNGKSHLLRETMKAMEQKLDPRAFLRIRRSQIVRIEQIKELHPLFNGEFEIVLKNDIKLCSSRRYRKNLDSLLKP